VTWDQCRKALRAGSIASSDRHEVLLRPQQFNRAGLVDSDQCVHATVDPIGRRTRSLDRPRFWLKHFRETGFLTNCDAQPPKEPLVAYRGCSDRRPGGTAMGLESRGLRTDASGFICRHCR
jgi:hypothetical protein